MTYGSESVGAPTGAAVDLLVESLKSGMWATADLVRIAYAVANLGKNTTSILGQYGEELTAEAFGGSVVSFAQKAFDVSTPNDGDLQVKTFAIGKRPGAIRSFTHDVVTLEVDPETARVVSAKRYAASDLYDAFSKKFASKYADLGMAWNGGASDRFERGWSLPRGLPFDDVTEIFQVKTA